jgi:hypothetical protein
MDSRSSVGDVLWSFGEFVVRTGLSWWARVAGFLAVVAFLLAKLIPHVHVPGQLWLWILGLGGALSLFTTFHAARMERDRARAAPIAPGHGKEVIDRARVSLNCVRDRLPVKYDDATPPSRAAHASYCAHYPVRCEELERWNEQISQEQLCGKIREEIRRAAESDEPDAARIDSNIFSVPAVVDCVWAWLLKTAAERKLDEPAKLRWQHHDLPDRCDLELEGVCVGALPPGSPGELEAHAKGARAQVFALAEAVRGWDDAGKIMASAEAAERLRGPLMAALDLDLRAAEDLRRSDRCDVCQHYLVIHGAPLPRWFRRSYGP